MAIIEEIIKRAKADIKRIVLPECDDERIIKSGLFASNEGIAKIIFLGDYNVITKKYPHLNFANITFINPKDSIYLDNFVHTFYEMRKSKGLTLQNAYDIMLNNYNYFACMLVKEGLADGVVSGANHTSKDVLKPALEIIKANAGGLVSSFFLMDVKKSRVFLFADAGLVQEPTAKELAIIASSSATSFELLTNEKSRIAFLSHSTHGSATHPIVTKVVEATKITKREYPHLLVDGELQLDAAIIPEVAAIKAPNSPVAGYANTLIFPNIDAGNIGYKLVERLADADAFGPITQGINAPVNDLSRGASVNDIIGVIAITCVQCQQKTASH